MGEALGKSVILSTPVIYIQQNESGVFVTDSSRKQYKVIHVARMYLPQYMFYTRGRLKSVLTMDLFVLRFYGPVNPVGSCRAQSVYLISLLLGRQSSERLTSFVYILLPETDNCRSWVSGRERMTVENIS